MGRRFDLDVWERNIRPLLDDADRLLDIDLDFGVYRSLLRAPLTGLDEALGWVDRRILDDEARAELVGMARDGQQVGMQWALRLGLAFGLLAALRGEQDVPAPEEWWESVDAFGAALIADESLRAAFETTVDD